MTAIIGTAGDRPDDTLRGIGRIAAERAQRVVLKETLAYLRGRDREEIIRVIGEGLAEGGLDPATIPVYESEVTALESELVGAGSVAAGDRPDAPRVIVLFCHQDRDAVFALLERLGAHGVDVATELGDLSPRLADGKRRPGVGRGPRGEPTGLCGPAAGLPASAGRTIRRRRRTLGPLGATRQVPRNRDDRQLAAERTVRRWRATGRAAGRPRWAGTAQVGRRPAGCRWAGPVAGTAQVGRRAAQVGLAAGGRPGTRPTGYPRSSSSASAAAGPARFDRFARTTSRMSASGYQRTWATYPGSPPGCPTQRRRPSPDTHQARP